MSASVKSRMVYLSGTDSPGLSRTKGRKMDVLWWWWLQVDRATAAGNMFTKFHEVWTCMVYEIYKRTQTDRQTNVENRSIFGEVTGKSVMACIYRATLCSCGICYGSVSVCRCVSVCHTHTHTSLFYVAKWIKLIVGTDAAFDLYCTVL